MEGGWVRCDGCIVSGERERERERGATERREE